MAYDPRIHRRRSIRLRNYDYADAGAYFVTLCTSQRASLFGDVVGDSVCLTRLGEIARDEWLRSTSVRAEVALDEFVIMPNHVHAIVFLHPSVGATGRSPLRRSASGPSPRSLGSLVAGFKSAVTSRINAIRGTPGLPVWQRNYHERVIRSESELGAVRQYIRTNPVEWAEDPDNLEVRR